MSNASAAPPADGQKSFLVWFSEVVAAVVEMVSVEVCAVVPEKLVSDAGDRLQVAGSVDALVVKAQVRATDPVNPGCGAMVMVEVLPLVAPGVAMVTAVPVTVKVGGAVTVNVTVPVSVRVPDVPVVVTV
jgi:hypothetical protein